jgi:hypothetical protein
MNDLTNGPELDCSRVPWRVQSPAIPKDLLAVPRQPETMARSVRAGQVGLRTPTDVAMLQ